jgi:hypothetical protein
MGGSAGAPPRPEEFAGGVQSAPRRTQPADLRLKHVRHAGPDRARHEDACRAGPFRKAQGVVEKHLVVADVDAQGGQAGEIRPERRGAGVLGRVALQILCGERAQGLLREDRVGFGAVRIAGAGERKVAPAGDRSAGSARMRVSRATVRPPPADSPASASSASVSDASAR